MEEEYDTEAKYLSNGNYIEAKGEKDKKWFYAERIKNQ